MNKYKRAQEEGRLAMVPNWLQEGCTVWFWDSVDCPDERCADHGKFACPLRSGKEVTEIVSRCRRVHPVLRKAEVWSLAAHFTPGSVWIIINDFFQIRAEDLHNVFFKTTKEAFRHKPREAMF